MSVLSVPRLVAASALTLSLSGLAAAQQPGAYVPPPPPAGYPVQPVAPPAPVYQPAPTYQPAPAYPPPAPVYQPQPVYPAYPQPVVVVPGRQRSLVRYDTRPRTGLIIGGSVLLGVTWLSSVLAAGIVGAINDACTIDNGSSCLTSAWPLYLPVVGPFIQLGYVQGQGLATARTFLVIDGLLQAGGLAMILAGALTRRQVPVYAGRVQFAPSLLGGGAGLAAMGRF